MLSPNEPPAEDHEMIHFRLQAVEPSRREYILAAEVRHYDAHLRSCTECRMLYHPDERTDGNA